MRWKFGRLRHAALLLAAGIVLHDFVSLSVFSILSVMFLIILILFPKKYLPEHRISFFCYIVLVAGFLTALYADFRLGSGSSLAGFILENGKRATCEGIVNENSTQNDKLIIEDIKCQAKKKFKDVSGRLQLKIYNTKWFDKKMFNRGDVVRFYASIKKPRDFKNFNRPVFETYYRSRGISAVGYVSRPEWIRKIDDGRNIFLKTLNVWRAKIETSINFSAISPQSKNLIKTIIFGDKNYVADDFLENLKIIGAVHLIVVSGLHVGVVALLFWWMVILLGAPLSYVFGQRDLRKAAAFISILFVWIFVGLTGAAIPAVRAAIAATVYLGAIMFERDVDKWDMLSLAVIIILMTNPLSIHDVSFQLSFFAVAGIFVFSKYFGKNIIVNYLILSAGAFAGIFPLLSFHFGKIPIMGPFVSLVVSPIIIFAVVPLSVAAGFAAIISSFAGTKLFHIIGLPADIFIYISNYLAEMLGFSYLDASMNIFEVVAVYLLILSLISVYKVRRKAIIVLLLISLLIGGKYLVNYMEDRNGKLCVTFLDVGQGAAVVVQLPDAKTILIDGGGIKGSSIDLGKSVLDPFLKKLDVEVVNKIIITHPHPDHYKGLAHIVENFHPAACLTTNYSGKGLVNEDMSEWSTFLGRVEHAGVPIENLKLGSWNESGVNFHVLSPPDMIPESWSVNDMSAVIKIEYGDVSFLITGDAESYAEAYVLNKGSDLSATVLQVPHHGSSSSSGPEFLDEVSAQYGVIQAGASNNYGFPNSDVIARLEERDVRIFRTDQDGAVAFITDGEQIKIYSAVGK